MPIVVGKEHDAQRELRRRSSLSRNRVDVTGCPSFGLAKIPSLKLELKESLNKVEKLQEKVKHLEAGRVGVSLITSCLFQDCFFGRRQPSFFFRL